MKHVIEVYNRNTGTTTRMPYENPIDAAYAFRRLTRKIKEERQPWDVTHYWQNNYAWRIVAVCAAEV